MGERGRRRRVGQVVGGDVDRLDRGDRALLGRGDPLLERAHVRRQRGLIADRGRDAPEQGGDFGAGLREAEDVVDEEQHVLPFLVAEILRLRQAGEPDPRARARRLVHLAVDERHLGLVAFEVDDPGFDHLVVEIVALAGPLADAGENRIAAVLLRDVVDQLHDDHGLADPGTAEQPDLAALRVGRKQVHHLDARDQDLGFRRLLDEGRRRGVDRPAGLGLDGTALVDRVADHVDDAPQHLRPHRHRDAVAGIDRLGAAHEAVRGVHGDAADGALAQMLRHFEDEPAAPVVDVQGVQDWRERAFEPHVNDRAHDLGDLPDRVFRRHLLRSRSGSSGPRQSASAPEMISISSLVICACRVRL